MEVEVQGYCLLDFPTPFGKATTAYPSLPLTTCSPPLCVAPAEPPWASAPTAPCPECRALTHPRALLKRTWYGDPHLSLAHAF